MHEWPALIGVAAYAVLALFVIVALLGEDRLTRVVSWIQKWWRLWLDQDAADHGARIKRGGDPNADA